MFKIECTDIMYWLFLTFSVIQYLICNNSVNSQVLVHLKNIERPAYIHFSIS
jgi:hypothetical protein